MKIRIATLALMFLCMTAPSPPASAGDGRVGDMAVMRPWARATPGMARTGAVYLTMSNHGAGMDRLVATSTPVAKRAELHSHVMENNIMKMRRLSAIEVHPGKPSVLRPGGRHVMLMGLNRPLKKGDVFPLVLRFETAGRIEVRVEVGRIGAMQPRHNPHDGHHRDGHKGRM